MPFLCYPTNITAYSNTSYWWESSTTTTTTFGTYMLHNATTSIHTVSNVLAAQARFEHEERVAREYVDRASRLHEAETRAKQLLLAHLSDIEAQRLDTHNAIHVVGSEGTRFRIRRGRVGNVDVVDREGCISARLCCHPSGDLPDYDVMLAQKLALEFDEPGFRSIANPHPHPRTQIMESM